MGLGGGGDLAYGARNKCGGEEAIVEIPGLDIQATSEDWDMPDSNFR